MKIDSDLISRDFPIICKNELVRICDFREKNATLVQNYP